MQALRRARLVIAELNTLGRCSSPWESLLSGQKQAQTLSARRPGADIPAWIHHLESRPSSGHATGGRPGLIVPATFVCCASAGIFVYAMSTERNLEREWRSNLGRWYNRPSVPSWVPSPLDRWWLRLRDEWEQLTLCERLSWGLIGVNAGVFMLLRTPALGSFMYYNFVQRLPPARTPFWTLLTCNFSHMQPLHLAVNMYALNSLMGVPCSELGAPQAAALYMSSGLFSSLASHFGAWLGLRGKGAGATVGASGAIYGLAAATAALHPDFKAGIIFLPGFQMRLGDLICVVMGLDVLGVLLRWRVFDHWGHLGGALFGYIYAKYGETAIWAKRDRILAALDKAA